MSVLCRHTVPTDARKGCQILWNWGYRQLLAATWVLGTKPGCAIRAAVILTVRQHSSLAHVFIKAVKSETCSTELGAYVQGRLL